MSALLHAAALLALVPWPTDGNIGQAEAPPIEVEFVHQRDTTQGAPPVDATSPPVAAAPLPQPDAEAAPEPAGAPPAVAPPPSATSIPSAAAVNLGDADESQDGVDVTGRGVVPPSPDSAFRNQAPIYPIEAARQGTEGTVSLLVRVSAQGLPRDVLVANSSGSATLDRAARNAVRRWHFTPARVQGAPVPFDYPLDIRFVLGDRQ
jgi:protein TonB